MTDDTIRNRLVYVAAQLFREKGYNGAGIAEILKKANAPKGSLYHHFPNGKADLAKAAAEWTSKEMISIIDTSFKGKTTWQGGVKHMLAKLAKLFDISQHQESCPIKVMLFDGPNSIGFNKVAEKTFQSWHDHLAAYASQFGMPEEEAQDAAEMLLVTVEGAWTLARARKSSDILRKIPDHLFSTH